jgi:tripartite motif-containing protein 71
MTASPAVPSAIPEGAEVPEGTNSEPVDGTGASKPRRRKVIILLLLLASLAILLGLAIWYLLFRQPVPLPTLPGQVVMPAYVTSVYGATRPVGVAVSADGSRIYLGETGGDRTARVFDASGNQLAVMAPPNPDVDHSPVYLAVDPLAGEVYVTDRPAGAIHVYDAAGTYVRTFDPGEGFLGWQPLAITFDKAGNLYVTDVGGQEQRVVEFDRSGAVVRTIGEAEGLNFPNGVAVDANGNVVVTDSSNGRLLVFGPEGNVVASVGRGAGEGSLGLPRGVAIDANNRVYVGDATGHAVFVYEISTSGPVELTFLGSFGGQGADNGTFQYPNGVAVDARGRVYVADTGNDRVQLWSY